MGIVIGSFPCTLERRISPLTALLHLVKTEKKRIVRTLLSMTLKWIASLMKLTSSVVKTSNSFNFRGVPVDTPDFLAFFFCLFVIFSLLVSELHSVDEAFVELMGERFSPFAKKTDRLAWSMSEFVPSQIPLPQRNNILYLTRCRPFFLHKVHNCLSVPHQYF